MELRELLDEMCGIQAGYEMAGDKEARRLDAEMEEVRGKIFALFRAPAARSDGWVPNPDRDALCRPAVKHYLNMLERQILRCDQGLYPAYYKPPFEREAEQYHKLLADIDENLDRHNKSAPASGAAKGE